jgi:hypothetical protein
LYPSSEFSLVFLNIGSDNGFAGISPAGRARTKPLVAMTAHASRPPAPQTVTTPSDGYLRSADFPHSAGERGQPGYRKEGQGRTANAQSLPSTTPQESCTIADEGVILDPM